MKSDTFGKRLQDVRKAKKLSQDDVAKSIGVHGAVIGRYERDEVKPSIDTAKSIAEALNVSLDYLVGSTDLLLDKTIIKTIQEIQQLNQEDQEHCFALLQAFIAKQKIQKLTS